MSAPEDSASPSDSPASGAADRFLATYVAEDGRVLRHDQGGDVVSEGQAYGMLIAELAGREDLVPLIWAWTSDHLRRPDGLLSFRATGEGEVVGADAASDADVLAAFALLRYDGDDAEALHAEGRALAEAVLEHEVLEDARGRPVLAAGQWAVEPGIVNPSYWMPAVFDELAALTGDDRWTELADAAVDLVVEGTDDGRRLPSDWARVRGSELEGVADASGAAGTPTYGPDAQRTPLWFATGCSDTARELAARWWSILQVDARSSALVLDVTGEVQNADAHPVPLLATAAAAGAAGDDAAVADLERGAAEVAEAQPGYYGDAWLALAEGLRTGSLTGCP